MKTMSRPYEKAEEKEEAEEKRMCVFLVDLFDSGEKCTQVSCLVRSNSCFAISTRSEVAIRGIHCALTSLNFNFLLVMPPPTSSASDIDHVEK